MNRRTLFAALAVSGALCACIDEPPLDGPDAGDLEEAPVDDLAAEDEALPEMEAIYGVFEVGSIWDEDTITVCFENDAMAPELAVGRAATDQAADRWEAVSRINFVGWQPCSQTVNPDIRIGNSAIHSWSYFGVESRGQSPSMRINLGCQVPDGGCIPDETGEMCVDNPPPSVAQCVREIAVHEFGHALGLRHEHAHGDETCDEDDDNNDSDDELLDSSSDDGEELWSYDPSSVMSYCVSSDVLSQGDVRSITSLYPSQVFVYPSLGLGGTRSVVGPGKTLASAMPALTTGESIVVSAGLTATVCTQSNTCQILGVGRHDLHAAVANAIASIEVTPRISVQTQAGFRGTGFGFANGTFHANNGSLPVLANNNIESVYVGHNFDVRMCPDVGSGTGGGVCHEFPGGPEWDQALFVKIGPGIHNTASYVEVIPKVAFYDEVKFRGTGATRRVGVYTSQSAFTNAKSLTIPPALYVHACDAVTAQGGPAGTCRSYTDSLDLPGDHAAKLKYVSVQKKLILQWP